jgi:DNA recombination protein RmuC
METTGILLLGMVLVLLLVLIIIQLRPRDSGLNQQVIDMKNQLLEMKTAQMQSQNQSLGRQTELFQQAQKAMSEQLNTITRTVNENLSKTQGNITSQLGQTGTVVSEIQKKLGLLEESTNQMKAIGKDIASLQDILRAPKLRGNLGEFLLEDLLQQVFPAGNYTMKYSFKNSVQVDAIIRLGEWVIPVDAKFPLEAFQRLLAAPDEENRKKNKKEFIKSVKTRIDEIADKYIRPDEGTFDFALMYIPAENVFYETMISDTLTEKNYEIFNYAMARHVIPVSPNSFYAYLMAIAFGLKGLKVEQQTKEILKNLVKVQDSFTHFYADFCLLGKHISNAGSKYDDTAKKAEKFHDQLVNFTGIPAELPSGVGPGDQFDEGGKI